MKKAFVSSSKESVAKAIEIGAVLETLGVEAYVWNQSGVFLPGEYTLEALEKISDEIDMAIIVFDEDDTTWYRNDEVKSVRDNVLIEYGLFVGKLGRQRVAIAQSGNPKTASDILGLNIIDIDMPNRAKIEIGIWVEKVKDTRIKRKNEEWIQFGNFNSMFMEVCKLESFKCVRFYVISSNRTVRILEGSNNLHIGKAEVLLRDYYENDMYYDKNMRESIQTSIGLWEKMRDANIIDELIIKRFNYHIESGYYIFDDSYLIIGNLHFTYPAVSVHFDNDAILITNKTDIGQKIIHWYIKKFDNIARNFDDS